MCVCVYVCVYDTRYNNKQDRCPRKKRKNNLVKMKLKNEKKYQMDYNECKALVNWHYNLDHEIMKKIRECAYAIEDNRLYFSIMKFMHQSSFQLILYVFEQDRIAEQKLPSKKGQKNQVENTSDDF